MKRGFFRNSSSGILGPDGVANSFVESRSIKCLDVDDVDRRFFKASCRCRNWANLGSGFQGHSHWCETKIALPISPTKSTKMSSSMSFSCGFIASSFKTSSRGIVYIGKSIGISLSLAKVPDCLWNLKVLAYSSMAVLRLQAISSLLQRSWQMANRSSHEIFGDLSQDWLRSVTTAWQLSCVFSVTVVLRRFALASDLTKVLSIL